MIVHMMLIHMSSDHDLIILQVFIYELLSEFVRRFAVDLFWGKRLDDMVSLYPVCLMKHLFGLHHLGIRGFHLTADPRYQRHLIRFIGIDNIPDQLIQSCSLCVNLGYSHRFFHALISAFRLAYSETSSAISFPFAPRAVLTRRAIWLMLLPIRSMRQQRSR